jgi:hypothetical protein
MHRARPSIDLESVGSLLGCADRPPCVVAAPITEHEQLTSRHITFLLCCLVAALESDGLLGGRPI